MSTFSNSQRALQADMPLTGHWMQLLFALFAVAWGAWFFGARLTVLAVVDDARIETALTGHRVQTQVGGYVVAVHAQLDRSVEQGEVLVELDDADVRRELEQKLAEQRAARAEAGALTRQLTALESVRSNRRALRESYDLEAAVREAQTAALARAKQTEQARDQGLLELGAISQLSAARSQVDAERELGEARASLAARRRIEADQRLAEAELERQSTLLQRERAQLEGKLEMNAVRVLELEREIDRRKIRAPISGRLGVLAPVTVGSFVHAGDEVGTLIPAGGLRVIALFPPDQALGRIVAGQAATMRLRGFPWTQFGSLTGHVERVGRELRDGKIRVELSLEQDSAHRIPLQHGLPGSVEIAVEHTSPASLMLRAAGGRFGFARAGAR